MEQAQQELCLSRKRLWGWIPKPKATRTTKHADVCNGYLPTVLANEEKRKMGCAECDCWCHGNFSSDDGTDREDADAPRAEIRAVILEMKKNGQQN